MKKKILIIGLGSIGTKHAKILASFKEVSEIGIVSKRKNRKLKKVIYLKNSKNFNPDYIIVSTKTSEHYLHILNIEKNFKNKVVLIEKPLFEKFKKIKLKNNKYFVGYNLRFHPIINYIKKKINKNNIFSINIFCSSYLPYWRKNRNYKISYSADKKKGGGVLLDLSHELDYLTWLFGKIDKLNYFKINKISKLKINAEDNFILVGKINLSNFILNINFFSRSRERKIILDHEKFSLKGDLLKNKIYLFYKTKKKVINFKVNKDTTYLNMHKNILKGNYKNLCNYNEGLNLLRLIDTFKR